VCDSQFEWHSFAHADGVDQGTAHGIFCLLHQTHTLVHFRAVRHPILLSECSALVDEMLKRVAVGTDELPDARVVVEMLRIAVARHRWVGSDDRGVRMLRHVVSHCCSSSGTGCRHDGEVCGWWAQKVSSICFGITMACPILPVTNYYPSDPQMCSADDAGQMCSANDAGLMCSANDAGQICSADDAGQMCSADVCSRSAQHVCAYRRLALQLSISA